MSAETPNAGQTDIQALSPKDRAEILAALAESARKQFDRLADVAWKLRLSVWTAFSAASGLILTTEKWKPSAVECILGILLTLAIVWVMLFIWSPYNYKRSARFSRVSRFWETEIWSIVGIYLPDHLRAEVFLGLGDCESTILKPWYKHPNYLAQGLVTVLFGLLLIVSLLSRSTWS